MSLILSSRDWERKGTVNSCFLRDNEDWKGNVRSDCHFLTATPLSRAIPSTFDWNVHALNMTFTHCTTSFELLSNIREHTFRSRCSTHDTSTSTRTSLLHPASNSISSQATSTSTSNTGASSAILTVCIGTTFSEIMTKTSSASDFSCRVET